LTSRPDAQRGAQRRGGEHLVIAIDGPAGAGKSTAARALAVRLGYRHVDSGAMYRAVGVAAQDRGIDAADTAALARLVEEIAITLESTPAGERVLVDERDVTQRIREPLAGEWASPPSPRCARAWWSVSAPSPRAAAS
jgi:cytidylate kinase